MSNSLAIGAVTATLRNLLTSGIRAEGGGITVTTLPPDRASTFGQADGAGRVNLFLYQAQHNAAWRNRDLPHQVRPGESGASALALDLFYLLTAYERTEGDVTVLAHRLLGRAMRVLHDHPTLGADEIRSALVDNDLADQIERVRITPQPLSIDEASKLWTMCQTGYRISSAYQVSVVLIESTRAARAAPPVLQRGEGDHGPEAVAGSHLPMIEEVVLPHRQSSALLGDELTIRGHNLSNLAGVRFTVAGAHAEDAPSITLVPSRANSTDREIKLRLPDDAEARARWQAGFYTVAVVVNRKTAGADQAWSSNELPLSLAPRIETIARGNVIARDEEGQVTLTLTCSPEVRLASVDAERMRFDQHVMLLLGSARQILPQAPVAPPPAPAEPPKSTNTLTFQFPVTDAEVGEYLVRLRVDGVDLALVDRSVGPPRFDARQKVTIT
jgi:hypothetical protein